MRHLRHQRIISLQNNKENEHSVNNNAHLNLPLLRNTKPLPTKEHHLSINPRKRTFLNICTKKSALANERNSVVLKQPLETTRNTVGNTLSSRLSGICITSRVEKRSLKSVFKEKSVQ
jgi:hypothetical protein